MKMFFFGAILKSKIELLLKVLSFHLQLKFFAVAVAGLMINLARFWIEIKRQPQKVSDRVPPSKSEKLFRLPREILSFDSTNHHSLFLSLFLFCSVSFAVQKK